MKNKPPVRNNSRTTGILIAVGIAVFLFIRILSSSGPGKIVNRNKYDKDPGKLNRSGKLILSKHAKCRMECRHITFDEIRDVVESGTINERKSDFNPNDPKYALEAYSEDKQHIRVIIAPENNGLVVVSCIDLDNEWPCDCN